MKPHIICHMASSIDGRILPKRWRPGGQPGSLYERLHDDLAGDAWLVGRVTGQEFARGQAYPPTTARFAREPFFAGPKPAAYGIALDGEGKISWGRSEVGGDPLVVALTEGVSDQHLAGLRADGVSYVFAGKTQLDLRVLVETLQATLGVRRLIVEGGGLTNGAFLRAGLVDEVSLILWPTVDGAAGAPAVFDSLSEHSGACAPVEAMRLTDCQKLEGGAVWLRYCLTNRSS